MFDQLQSNIGAERQLKNETISLMKIKPGSLTLALHIF